MYEVITNSQYLGKDFFNFDTTSKLPRHRWYYLKEGFSASLIEEAINHKLSSVAHFRPLNILEPFCGTGTTPLTASLLGHSAIAIEVNPFLAFTSKVKNSAGKWDEKEFVIERERTVNQSIDGAYSKLEDFSTFTQRSNLKKWLFNKSVLRRFTSLLNTIRQKKYLFSDALELAAIVAAYRCCNAKRDGKALRYKTNWIDLNYSADDFIREFKNHSNLILDDLNKYTIQDTYQADIRIGDTRQILPDLDDNKFDLVITSPPYLNSFDYSDIYRPELFLGNYVNNNEALKEIRLKTLRSHVQVNWPEQISFESVVLNPILQNINQSQDLWNKKIPLMVNAYFDDIFKVFCALKPKMRLGGQIWLVVSTSAFGGVHIPVDLVIADAASQAGFNLKGIHCLRRLRTAGQQWKQFDSKSHPLRESLIIFSN